jgi:membrane fusion protein, copper/silver efflux system
MTSTPDTQPATPAISTQAKAMDAAAEHARHRADRPRRASLTVAIALAVGAVGFFAGRQFASHSDGAGSTATTPAAGHAHGAQSTGATSAEVPAAQLWTCSMHPQVIQPDPGICPICHMELTPLKADGAAGAGGTITIDPVVVQNMGVRVADVTSGRIVQSVRVVGYLEEPEPLHRDINLRVNGWIEKLYANIDGMVITEGQPLFDLYSPELTIAIDELIAARRQADRGSGNGTGRELLESSHRKLMQLGVTEKQIVELAKAEAAPSTLPILAPMSGHLTAKMVYEGAAVKAGDLVLRLASRHRMWIDAQVPEQQMSLVSDGQPVRATLVSQPGKTFTGKVLFVHPHLDPQTRTALVRIEIDNKELALRQGMYATVEILADAYREGLTVPREAVIDTGRRQLVFVALGDGRFAPRDVRLGLPGQDGAIEIQSGIQPGESVVTSGQFLLDSESRLKEAVAKHLSGGLPGHAAHAQKPDATRKEQAAPAVAGERIAVPHADDILREYLAIAKKLGARQEADTPLDVAKLVETSAMAAEHANDAAKPLAKAFADAAAAMKGKSIIEQRAAFVAVSDAVIDIARKARLSDAANPTLYVMHCPMAFDDKGAHWLQDEAQLANPYYATQMKRCGEVVEQIEPKK